MKTPECVCTTPEEYIRVALAIETLAYHDKNYLDSCLAKSNARISEEVQSLLTEALRLEALKGKKESRMGKYIDREAAVVVIVDGGNSK